MEPTQPATATQNNRGLNAHRPVLLADADSEHCARLCSILSALGLPVCVAPDGAKAVEMALGADYALILMCLDLPVLGGARAAVIIGASGCRTPIVALVGAASAPIQVGVGSVFIATLPLPVSAVALAPLLVRQLIGARADSADFADLPEFAALSAQFAQRLPMQLAQMGQAALAGHWAELANVAHTLRGTAGTFGHAEVGALAGQIEQAVRAANYTLAYQLLASLDTPPA